MAQNKLRSAPLTGLAIALSGVICGFLAVTIVAQRQTLAIDQLARAISENAGPSIDRLTEARGAVHRLGLSARQSIAEPVVNRAAHLASIARAKTDLHQQLVGYAELPVFPGERARYQTAMGAIVHYEWTIDRALERLQVGDLAGARTARDNEMGPAGERADEAFEQLVRFNTDHVIEIGRQIQHARRHATLVSYLLHGLAALIAVFAFGIVLRGLRTQTRLTEERTKLVMERAHELETFASRVAHDIKNPLAVIALRVATATHGGEAKMRDALLRTGQSIGRINQIVEGLLDFSRAGGRPVIGARTEVVAAIHDLVTELQEDAASATAELSAECGDALEVAAPPWAVGVVLRNLLRNALKFIVESSGPPRITVRTKDAGRRVYVEVDDTGPGIPAGFERAIFEPYVRAPESRQPGLGIGLATVKRIVETYGGAIGARSQPGQGSCFWFDLPKPALVIEAQTSAADLTVH